MRLCEVVILTVRLRQVVLLFHGVTVGVEITNGAPYRHQGTSRHQGNGPQYLYDNEVNGD